MGNILGTRNTTTLKYEQPTYKTIKLRDMDDKTFKQLVNLRKEAFPKEHTKTTARDTREAITDELEGNDGDTTQWVLAMTKDETLAGVVAMRDMKTPKSDFTFMYFLAVKKEFRRKGIGRKLFDTVVQNGAYPQIRIDVNKHETALVDMYKRWGATAGYGNNKMVAMTLYRK